VSPGGRSWRPARGWQPSRLTRRRPAPRPKRRAATPRRRVAATAAARGRATAGRAEWEAAAPCGHVPRRGRGAARPVGESGGRPRSVHDAQADGVPTGGACGSGGVAAPRPAGKGGGGGGPQPQGGRALLQAPTAAAACRVEHCGEAVWWCGGVVGGDARAVTNCRLASDGAAGEQTRREAPDVYRRHWGALGSCRRAVTAPAVRLVLRVTASVGGARRRRMVLCRPCR